MVTATSPTPSATAKGAGGGGAMAAVAAANGSNADAGSTPSTPIAFDENVYRVRCAYLRPLLTKHAAGQSLTHEDLIKSNDAARAALRGNVAAAKDLELLHASQLTSYADTARTALRQAASSFLYPPVRRSADDAVESYEARCVDAAKRSYPQWNGWKVDDVVKEECLWGPLKEAARERYAKVAAKLAVKVAPVAPNGEGGGGSNKSSGSSSTTMNSEKEGTSSAGALPPATSDAATGVAEGVGKEQVEMEGEEGEIADGEEGEEEDGEEEEDDADGDDDNNDADENDDGDGDNDAHESPSTLVTADGGVANADKVAATPIKTSIPRRALSPTSGKAGQQPTKKRKARGGAALLSGGRGRPQKTARIPGGAAAGTEGGRGGGRRKGRRGGRGGGGGRGAKAQSS